MATQAAESIFIDTNVWVNAAVPSAPHHSEALAALGRIPTGNLWTSRQVIREFLAVMSRPQTFFAGNAPIRDVLARVAVIESQCRVAEDGAEVARQLASLLEVGDTRGKQVHDANIVATMLTYRVHVLLTENTSDFARWARLIEVRGL